MTEQPAFEIRSGDKTYRIYQNGMVEGFDEKPLIILNRIPALIAQAVCLSKSQP